MRDGAGALTFVRHGMEGVTCTFGTANFTDEVFNAIVASKAEAVRIAFDGDKAGDDAAEKAVKRLASVGIGSFRLRFPREADANSYALDQGGEALKRIVRNAERGRERGRGSVLSYCHLGDGGQCGMALL